MDGAASGRTRPRTGRPHRACYRAHLPRPEIRSPLGPARKGNALMTRIKCCGMTRLDDVQLAARLGADAVGFVFTRRSKRFIEPEAAASLRAALPPFVDAVALL